MEKSENEIISKKIHIEKPKTTIEPEPQKEIITKIEEKMVIEKEIQIKIEPQNKMDILKIQVFINKYVKINFISNCFRLMSLNIL